ncbi:DUF7134 domain-containing protein [Nocardiopsis synnemataformans]|uniref:DUF7134 domain-containing protein n=1 Tax=Nocardiopsis synnemataformans TaxID=61305 RepID=UPI003EBB3A68
MSITPATGRPRVNDAVVAGAVLVIELLATYGSVNGDPLDPVAGWNTTQPTDPWAFVIVVVGCAALYWRRASPLITLSVATGAYSVFLLRDHEPGMFLAPMVALHTMASLGYARFHTALAGIVCMSASLWWVHVRTADITDPGVGLLAWVAFGTVILVFFAGSYVVGELVRCRRLLLTRRDGRTAPEPEPTR